MLSTPEAEVAEVEVEDTVLHQGGMVVEVLEVQEVAEHLLAVVVLVASAEVVLALEECMELVGVELVLVLVAFKARDHLQELVSVEQMV